MLSFKILFRLRLLVLVFSFVGGSFAAKASNINDSIVNVFSVNDSVFTEVDESATFQGGDANVFRKWVQQNVIIPEELATQGITGKVIVQFIVNTNGSLANINVLRGVHPSLDREVVRVIKSSPKWVPAKHKGRVVKQKFVIPAFNCSSPEK